MSKYFKFIVTSLFVLYFSNIYSQVPTISSFSPTSGNVGTSVTITGTNFSTTPANNVVYFGAAKATVTAATATSLSLTVPAGSTYEPIAIINTSTGKLVQSKTPFKVTNSTISSFPVGSGSFVAPINVTAAAGASNWYEIGDMISVADYDGDGKSDIAKGSNTTSVNVLRNVVASTGAISTSSFSSAGNFTTGSASFEIASGDIDGDGKLDIVSIGTSNFSILRNTSTSGTISFATKVDVAASYQYRVKLADVDGDGRLDVITSSNYSSNFNVYLNTSSIGTISFNTTPTSIGGLNGSRHITIGDINMDGKTDVIAANEGTTNALLFLNTSTSGSVSFGSGIAVAGGYWYNSVGDFDGDGKNDILSNGGNVSLLTNNYTSGTFTSSNLTNASNISSSDGLSYTTQSDFNGDGKIDYFTSFQNSGSYVYWYKNNYTSGAFSASSFAANSASFSSPYQMIICDFDGDGKQDIVSSASSNAFVQIARNKIGEDPTITTTGTLSAYTSCAGINSSNQNFSVTGTNLTANISITAPTGFEISTTSNSGFGSSLTLTPSTGSVASTTIYVRTTTAATGNPSGNIALSSTGASAVNVAASATISAAPTLTGTLSIYNGNTTQLTGSATANASNPWVSSNTAVATVNSSGLVTSVSVGTSTITYMNTNSCTVAALINVQAPPISISSFSPTSGAVGTSVTITGVNFNTTAANNIVRLNGVKCTVTSATSTQLVVTIPSRTGYGKFLISNTGINQVAYSNNKFNITPSAPINPISNTQFSVNSLSTNFSSNTYGSPKTHFISDIDDDGKMDFVFYNSSGDLNVFRNTSSSGAFTSASVTLSTKANSTGWSTYGGGRFFGGDMNGDGKMDFGASNGGYNGGLANMNASTSGTISFNASSNIKASDGNYNVTNGQEAFDINGDGKLDIIGFYNTSPAWVYLSQNTSSGSTFSVNTGNTSNSYAYSFTTSYLPTVTETFDVDGDGKQDLVYGTSSGLYVMKNTTALGAALSSFSLTNSTIATGLNSVSGITTADINADGKLDVIITQGSNVSTYINNSTSGTISFASAVSTTLASTAKGVGVGDLDGDGKIDIIVSDGSYTYYLKNTTSASTATFNTAVQIATQSFTDLNVFDADGDGKQDVVGTDGYNFVALRNKNGEDPTINLTGSLTSFVTCAGTASNSQTFTVSAINLTASATITAPTGYEISTSAGSGYGSTLTLTQTAGSIASTLIYVRLSAAATGNPSGNIALSSTGAITVNVAATGTANALPTITGSLTTTTIGTTQLTGSATANASTPWVSASTSIATISNTGLVTGVAVGTSIITYKNTNGCSNTATVTVTVPPPVITTTGSLSAFTKCSGLISTAQTFTVSGQYLTANIALAALTGFEYSTDGTTYASTLSLAPTAGTLNTTTIYVRMTAAVATNPSGNMVLTTTGGNTVNVAASGTVNALPTISGNTYLTFNGSAQLSGSATANVSTPWQSSNTAIATVNSTGLVSAVSLGTSTITYTNANNCAVTVNISVNTPAPIVSSFTPISGNIGSSITITGTDFSSTAANNIVFFGSVKGTVTAASSTSLIVTVPAGAKVASIKVINTDNNLSGVTSKSFVPTYTNANPAAIASTHFTTLQMTTATNPAAVTSATWSSVRHNGGVSDIDGDGKVDLLMVDNSNSRIAIYKNAASAGSLAITNFSTIVYASTITGPTDIEVEDINNDGKPDLVVTNGGTTLSVLINTSTIGNISFAAKQDFTVASSMIVKVADVNEDGRPDIITAARGGSTVNIYANTTTFPSNTITLGTVTSLTGATSIYDIVIKDINNDNKPDINLAASTYYAFINTNSSPNTTSFTQSLSKTTSAGLYSIQVEDYNLDNKNDVVFGFMGAANGGMFQNNFSTGSIANTDFSTEITVTNLSSSSSQYAWQLQSGDFNGDGKPDILNTDFNAGSNVRIVTNSNTMGLGNTLSSVNFAGAYVGSSSSYGNSFAVDLDNDGKPDWANFSNNRIDIGRNKTGEDPTITKASNFSSFVTCPNTASASQTFTVSGTYLTANISITVPTGYEISTTAGSGYASSLTLTQVNGVVTNTTVYIRLATTASGTPTGNITFSSTGATSQNIAVSGTLNALPTISIQPSITAQAKCINVAATPLTVTATGTNIAYQWYSNTTNTNTGGSLITGANSATYTPSTATAGIAYYYVVISGACTPSVTSNVSGIITTYALPSVTIGSITSPLSTATTFSLPFSSAVSIPNQYSISAGSQNIMNSFVAVSNATLVSSPISVTIPQSIANSYDFNLTVKNTTTGCVSNNIPFTIVVAKATPTLTGFIPINKTYGAANFNLTNPTSASTGTYSYTISDPNVATIIGNTVTIIGAGTATITATQAGDNSYNSATTTATLTVAKATNTLSNFSAINKTYGDNSFSLTNPTSLSSGNISYTSSNTNVATVSGNSVTIVGAGTATITATQAADNNYNSATISSTLTVAKANPILSGFSDLTNNYGDASFTLSAPTSNSNGAFTYSSSNTSVAAINGNIITIVGAGTATITANQAANSNFNSGNIAALISINKIDPTISNFSVINKTYGSAPFTITAPYSNSNGTFSYTSSDNSIASISGSIITIVGAGTASITATQAGNNNFNSNNNTITTSINIIKATPLLSGFNAINKIIGESDFTLTDPTSNSSGSFTYTSSDPNIAIINGNVVSIVAVGTVTITAVQASDNNYNANSITTSLNITKPLPTLSGFNNLNKNFGDATFTLTDPTSNSTGNFTYASSNPNVATITGSTVSIVGAGTTTITATQSSDVNFETSSISSTLTISKVNPSLSIFNSINKTFGDANFNIAAPSSNSNGTITYTSSNTSVATISGNTITIVGAGTATITASQASTSNFNNGTIASSLTVSKANPTFGIFNNINKSVGDVNFTITAPTSNSTGTYIYTISDNTVATNSGNIVTVVGAGTTTLTVTQASTNNYNSGEITALISVGQSNPTITNFPSISKTFGSGSFSLNTPNSNSNGAFTYTSSNSNVVSITGNVATIVGAGTATITASQAASTNYNTGSIVTSITVARTNPTITGFNTINKTYSDANFSITAPSSNSTGNFTYSSSNTNVATISGATITIVGAGTATITATQALDPNYNSGSIASSIIVSKANPTFGTFNNFNKAVGDANFTLTAPTSNSTGIFTYTSSNTNVATITGNLVSVIGAGTATITASQASTSNYNAASINATINVAQTNPTITNFPNINKTFGNVAFTLTAPVSNSNGTFTYTSSNTNVATISGNVVTIIGAGTASITATQSSTNNFNSGTITATIAVAKANPTIGRLSTINKFANDADFTINSPTSNSNATFIFNSSNTNVATINGNLVHIVGTGNSIITATQSNNNNYNSGYTTTTLSVAPVIILNRLLNDSISTHIDTLINGNISLNDSAPAVLYGNVIPDPSNLSGATLNLQNTGNYTFIASQPGVYKYTISACSLGQQSCPTSLLYIEASYLPQGIINLKYNTVLETDSIIAKISFSNGVAPYNITIKNSKNNYKISANNLNNNAIITIAPRSDSAIYIIESITDANNVTRYNKFTKDTAHVYIVKPEILLSLKATTPELIADSTFKLNLLLSVENKGVIDVNGVQVVADLTKVFPAGMEYILDSVSTKDSILVLNPNYKGINPNAPAGIGQPFSYSTIKSNSIVLSEADLFNFGVNLQKLQHGNVNFSFRIRPHSVTAAPVFQFVGSGKGQLIQDDGSVSLTPTITNASTDGLNPTNSTKPIPTYTPLFPVDYIGSALESSMPTIVNGGYIFHYNATIKNYSNENLLSINSILDLQNIFQSPDTAYIVGTPTFSNGATLNPNFDGYNDKKLIISNGILAVSDTINANFDLFVRTNQLQHNWKLNLTTSATSSLYNNSISDVSTNGVNPDPNNDNIPNESTYTISSVGFTAPANPTVKNLIYSLGNKTNPNDVSSMIVSIPSGSIPTWCEVNGNNCNTVAPALPTISGVYTWCIKSYDTTSGFYSTNCKYDTLTMLPNVITKKLTFVNTITSNPTNIGSSIVSISAGSKPKWCDLNGNNCSFNAPSIPNTVGTYIWTVAAIDTINNLTSATTVKDTLVILDPNKVVDLNKRIEKVTINADGSYTVQFNFIVTNNSGQILNSLSINDDLTKVFGNNIDFKVISIDNSGYLNKNPKYDGINNINLIGNNIILTDKKQDSISIKILVQGLHVDGDYTNTATATVNSDYGIFKVVSNDPIANPINTSNRIATKFSIPKINVIVAGGFSPNNDGIDDAWVVERPYGTKISVKVFNRWGTEVFKNYDYQNDWKGKGVSTFLGQDVQEGTYFYIVEATDINGIITKFNGSLTIVR